VNTYKRRRGEKGNDSAFSVRFIASIHGQDISHFPAGRSTVLWRRDERRERGKKMSSTDMYDDRVKSTRPLSLKEMDIYARLVGVYRVHARRHARNGRLNNSIRSPPLHIIYPRSYNAIREHICHFACPVIILSVKLCGSFSLMLQRRLI
jgi:hypothetical protein